MQHSHAFNDDNYSNISNIIEHLPNFLLQDQENTKVGKDSIKKINPRFKNFLNDLNEQLKIHEVHKEKTTKQKKAKIENIIKGISEDKKKWFSSFLEEYITEAVIDNDDFKEKYTLQKMNEIDLLNLKQQYAKAIKFQSKNPESA